MVQQVVGVVCGDAAQLLPELQQQHVIFIDPPWGGTQLQPAAAAAAAEVSSWAAGGDS
jgi:16S rRNA G966 N2-methylase RsmD